MNKTVIFIFSILLIINSLGQAQHSNNTYYEENTQMSMSKLSGDQMHYAIPCAGGEGEGSGGFFSFTVGQTFYTTVTNSSGIIVQGVQYFQGTHTEKYKVTFLVTDETYPLDGANITIADSAIITNTSGIATIDLANGTYGFEVFKDGYQNYSGSVTINNNDTEVEVVLAKLFALTIFAEGSGSTSPSVGEHHYTEGTSVNLYASPAAGYQFAKWVIGDEEIFTQDYTLIIAQDTTATAYFEETTATQYTLTLSLVGNGVISPPAGEHIFNEGSEVTLIAFADEGWQFDGWSGDLVSNNTNEAITINSDKSIVATFSEIEIIYHTITFNVTSNGSAVSDATITVEEIDEDITTNADGIATIDLEDGEYTFTVTKDGYVNYSSSFTVSGEDLAVYVVLEVVGIETDPLSMIRAYPNPFRSFITLDNAQGVSRVIITNLIGQQVMNIQLSGAERETIQTDGLIRGVYLITFQTENGERVVRKMIKE